MPTSVELRPRLGGDGLDHVVAVEALDRLEVQERPARAAGAAHVDADVGEAERVVESARTGCCRAGSGRSRSTRRRSGTGPVPDGKRDVGRQGGAVAGGEVAEPLVERLAVVEAPGRARGRRSRPPSTGLTRGPGAAHGVGAGVELAPDQAAAARRRCRSRRRRRRPGARAVSPGVPSSTYTWLTLSRTVKSGSAALAPLVATSVPASAHALRPRPQPPPSALPWRDAATDRVRRVRNGAPALVVIPAVGRCPRWPPDRPHHRPTPRPSS